MMIAKKSKQTQSITGEARRVPAAVPQQPVSAGQKRALGFCKGLYRKSSNINLEISRTVARGIVEFAKTHGVKVIVLENLGGWKAKAGASGSLMKQKFHLWCHSKIVEIVTNRWAELGGKIKTINPKYTSAYAFDRSGKVKRSKANYSLAKFTTGKQYNADLSASYNIGSRYWYCVLMGNRNFSRVYAHAKVLTAH